MEERLKVGLRAEGFWLYKKRERGADENRSNVSAGNETQRLRASRKMEPK